MSEKISLSVEVLTPLFLGGAYSRPEQNENGDPELRPPTFRGALRYWFRALLGSNANQRLSRIREVEGKIFGSVLEDSGFGSAVNVRIRNLHIKGTAEFKTSPPEIGTHGPNLDSQIPSGRDYLYWSMNKTHRDGQELPSRRYLLPESGFDLILQTRPTARLPEFKYAAAALWLLLNLGGVGSRSRRTAGSLSPADLLNFEGLQFQMPAVQNLQQAAEFLRNNLDLMRGWLSPAAFTSKPQFDVLSPEYCRIWVLGIWPTSNDAIRAMGERLRERLRSEPDHINVANWLNGKPIAEIKRSAFGLPIQYRYSNHGPRGILQARMINNKSTKFDRRASPLWLKITKTADGKYVGVATLFLSQFLPADAELYAHNAAPEHDPPSVPLPGDYSEIVNWVDTNFKNAAEVHYV